MQGFAANDSILTGADFSIVVDQHTTIPNKFSVGIGPFCLQMLFEIRDQYKVTLDSIEHKKVQELYFICIE
jgi:hypothetical protein